jgi:hypothetical protein
MATLRALLLVLVCLLEAAGAQDHPAPSGAPASSVAALELSIGLELEDGRIFHAILPVRDGRTWARFEGSTGGDPPATERILGARAHVVDAGGTKLVGLQLNNGTLDRDEAGNFFCRGIVRFRTLWLELRPASGQPVTQKLVFEDAQTGASRVLYKGPDIPWIQRKVVTLRFAITDDPKAGFAALTFADRKDWRPLAEDGTYGPGRFPVREASKAEDEEKRKLYAQALSAYASGKPAPNVRINSARAGPWMPPGYGDVMEPGGADIECYPDPGSRNAVLFALQMHARWQDRARDALYDENGEQLTVHSFATAIERVQLRQGPDAWGLELPFFTTGKDDAIAYRWFNGGPKESDAPVWAFRAEVTSHSIRTARHGVFAYAFTGDPSVREDLLQQFEARRISEYGDRADAMTVNPWGVDWVPPSLTKLAFDAAKHPHAGAGVDRAFGWMLHHGAVAMWLGYDRRAWLEKAVDTFELLAMEDCGVLHVNKLAKPWIPERFTGEQTFHSLIQYHGYYLACQQLGRAPKLLPLFCAAHFDNPKLPPQPYLYDPKQMGVPWWVALYDGAERIPVDLATSFGNDPEKKGDVQFNLHVLALCYRATGDERWLQASLRYQVPHSSLQQRKKWALGSDDHNYVGLMRETLRAMPAEKH